MTTNFNSFALAALLVLASLTANAVVVPHSKTIVVESPETHPILAEANPEAMYLHDTNDGRTLLYIEAENGRKLISLDVTDPSRIQRFTQSELPATSAYDFVRDLGDSNVLIRYRNGSGVALISLKHLKRPELSSSPALVNADTSGQLGPAVVLVSSDGPARSFARPAASYQLIDTSRPTHAAVLASIPDVQQSVSQTDTGTLFLLNKNGINVVRQLEVEVEHQIEEDQERGN
jgi:hypothetical protein